MESYYLTFFPYLSLSQSVRFGDWVLGPLREFDGKWPHPDFERLAKTFLSRFTDYESRPLPEPAVLGNKDGVFCGVLAENARTAVTRAVQFAVIDINERWTERRRDNAWHALTSDNAEMLMWPIDIDRGYVAVQRGSMMLSVLDGGWKVTDHELRIPAPAEVIIHAAKSLDEDMVKAVYDFGFQGLVSNDAGARRLMTAISWLAKAWRNTPSVQPEDRLVLLKTGFEALTDGSESPACAGALRRLFEKALSGASPTELDEVLWTPQDTPSMARTWTNRRGVQQTSTLTPLEHWFLAFADARNAVIHEGRQTAGSYREPSAFRGPFVFTAEWVLRTAIKLQLHLSGFPELWRGRVSRAWARASRAALRELQARDEPARGRNEPRDASHEN